MKENKYRFWDVVARKMITWEEIRNSPMSDKRLLGVLFDFIHDVTDNIIPLQYTGLKDKNGKEIYEGDIVKAKITNYKIDGWGQQEVFGQIIYCSKTCGFRVDSGGTSLSGFDYGFLWFEIIGNIYENPELVKGSHYEK